MPETRYIDTYDGQGNLISHEPYEVSDAQLAEELANHRSTELKDLLKQGAYVVVSMPQTGENRIITIQRTSDGKVDGSYEI